MVLASRMAQLGTEKGFEVLARARQLEAAGKSIIHLEVGDPDFDTPEHIRRAACEAINSGHTHYGPAAGDPEFRALVAKHLKLTRGVPYTADQIVIVPGGKPVIFLGMMALVNAGDEVVYSDPGYPTFESMANFLGARPVPIVLREENEFRLDVNELADLVTDRTSLIVLNSPHNPTGGVLAKDDLEAIAALAIDNDLMVLSDETYESIIYEGRQHSIAACEGMADRTLLLDCFSKSFAMTGWRLGFSASHPQLAEALSRLMLNANSCTSSFVQRAGLAALSGPQDATRQMVAAFKQRRDIIVEGLNSLPGISCLSPRGALYAFPNITGTGYSSDELYSRLLDEAGVAVLPGTAFGEHGEGYLRISFASSLDNINEALSRISELLS